MAIIKGMQVNDNDIVSLSDSTVAKASLSIPDLTHVFALNPDTAKWDYNDNATSMDTLGGRVIQLLSVKLNGLAITGRAGSRGELQRMADNIKQIMSYHVATQNPARLKVPSRNWDFQVYIQSMPALGWDVATTSYPYQLQFAIEDDLAGVQTKQITNAVLQNIQKDIGYNAGHHGGNAQVAYDIITTLTKPLVTGEAAVSGVAVDCTGSGAEEDGYEDGKLVKVQICNVPGIAPGVNSEIAQDVADMIAAAKADGVTLAGSGFRTMSSQISLYADHGCSPAYSGNPIPYHSPSGCSPPTAYPGYSNHQMGRAIDFASGGSSISSGSKEFQWLSANAKTYGLQNLPSESWHWSVDGG